MSLRKFIRSYKPIKKNYTFEIPLISPRPTLDIIFAIETTDGSDYSYDIGDGKVRTKPSQQFSVSEFLDINTSGNTTFYKKKSEIKTLGLGNNSHVFNSDLLFGFNNLESLVLNTSVTLTITHIPHSVNSFILGANGAVDGYAERRSFLFTTMRRFVLRNEQGTGLDTKAVDDLLIDLAVAEWQGIKRVEITGINASRSSSSDTAVGTLQAKGVIVLTN